MKPIFFIIMLLFLGACGNKTEQKEQKKAENISTMYDNFDFQGHRGARGLAPENTIPAFLKALEYGVTTLELDVVISKDSQIVISHEPWMNHDICSKPNGERISENEAKSFNLFKMDYAEIKTFDCGKLPHPLFPEQQRQAAFKPTLSMMTDAVATYSMKNDLQPVYFNIETKSQPKTDGIFHPKPTVFVNLLYNKLKSLGILPYCTIQSFDVRTLEVLHQLDTSVTTALLVYHEDVKSSTFEADLATLSFKPDIFSCNFDYLTPKMIRAAQDKNIKIIPWTVNDPADMTRLIEMGVDGLITDYPNRLKAILQ